MGKKIIFWSKIEEIVKFIFFLLSVSFQIFDDKNFEPLLNRIGKEIKKLGFNKGYETKLFDTLLIA